MGGQTACVNWERMLAFCHARFDRQPRAISTGAGLVQPAALERAGSSSAQDRTALRCLPQGQPDDAGDDRRSSSAASGRLECLSLRPAPIVVRLLSQPQRSQRSARLRLRHRRRRVLANEYRVKEATKSRLRVAKALNDRMRVVGLCSSIVLAECRNGRSRGTAFDRRGQAAAAQLNRGNHCRLRRPYH
jgi:hypothetical protein